MKFRLSWDRQLIREDENNTEAQSNAGHES
jgi:hypothetical protein